MKADRRKMEGRLRTSGVLLILGLAVEAASLVWSHPLAFLGFLLVGGTLLAAAIVFYLSSLVSTDSSRL